MTKAELRKIYLEKRMQIPNEQRYLLSQKIVDNFILQFNPFENQRVHCFLPIEKMAEVDTKILIKYCFLHHIRVFVPKILDGYLISIELTPETILKKNEWGIEEPLGNIGVMCEGYDYIITPLLYCDEQGHRVGYGKGFYDQLFRNLPDAIKVGVSFFSPKEQIADVWGGDVSLDYLVTPTEILSFCGGVR